VNQEPPWREGEGDHRIYCHIPLDELSRLQAETLVFEDEGAPSPGAEPDDVPPPPGRETGEGA
jgi:hypothetical protein